MTAELDIVLDTGRADILPVPITASDLVVLNSPCQLCGWSIRDAQSDLPRAAEGAVVAPAAGATIVSLTGLVSGLYRVGWTVELLGAAAAADANNFQLVPSVGDTIASLNAGAAGVYPQQEVEYFLNVFGSVTIKSIGAGTAGVTYAAQLTLEPTSLAASVVELQDGNNAIAEIGLPAGASDTSWFGREGVYVRQQIKLHVVSGAVTGAVYARYQH